MKNETYVNILKIINGKKNIFKKHINLYKHRTEIINLYIILIIFWFDYSPVKEVKNSSK